MTIYKTVCNSEQCCEISVDTETGFETILSCTGSHHPYVRMD